jgi:hypothetical protein
MRRTCKRRCRNSTEVGTVPAAALTTAQYGARSSRNSSSSPSEGSKGGGTSNLRMNLILGRDSRTRASSGPSPSPAPLATPGATRLANTRRGAGLAAPVGDVVLLRLPHPPQNTAAGGLPNPQRQVQGTGAGVRGGREPGLGRGLAQPPQNHVAAELSKEQGQTQGPGAPQAPQKAREAELSKEQAQDQLEADAGA